MKSKEYTIELFIDNLASGTIKIDHMRARVALGHITGVSYNPNKPASDTLIEQFTEWIKDRDYLREQENSKDRDDEYIGLKLKPDHNQHTNILYDMLIKGRLEGWITGKFDEADLQSKLQSMEDEIISLKSQRDTLLKELTKYQTELPPTRKDFQGIA